MWGCVQARSTHDVNRVIVGQMCRGPKTLQDAGADVSHVLLYVLQAYAV